MNEFNKENLKGIIKEAFEILRERGEWYDIPSKKNHHEDQAHRATENQQDVDADREDLFADIVAELMDEEGDEFKRGQIIAEVDSDKTTVELPALEDGKLIKILSKEGEEIEVGSDIAIFEPI